MEAMIYCLNKHFFCAIDPSEREKYIEKAKELLQPSGLLVGLLFQKELYKDHPPFGGDEKEYRKLFQPFFHYSHHGNGLQLNRAKKKLRIIYKNDTQIRVLIPLKGEW